jgi:hypothetical protein
VFVGGSEGPNWRFLLWRILTSFHCIAHAMRKGQRETAGLFRRGRRLRWLSAWRPIGLRIGSIGLRRVDGVCHPLRIRLLAGKGWQRSRPHRKSYPFQYITMIYL